VTDFSFLASQDLRRSLESDYRELRSCLSVEAWKAVHVLAGSIVEAILIDILATETADSDRLFKQSFDELITDCSKRGLLPEEFQELSIVIRKYRNLIHPGRLLRLNRTADRSGAIIAAEVVDLIATAALRLHKQKYGFTAEQLLEKVRFGESALPLVPFLVNETPPAELDRFLTVTVPTEFLNALQSGDTDIRTDLHLVACFEAVFDAVDEKVKLKVAERFYEIYRSEDEFIVLLYEDYLFQASLLKYLNESQQKLIKSHLLGRSRPDGSGRQLNRFYGIGAYLDAGEADTFAMSLLWVINGTDPEAASRAKMCLVHEYRRMSFDAQESVKKALLYLADAEVMQRLERIDEEIRRAS
jgi:hypothetical protein